MTIELWVEHRITEHHILNLMERIAASDCRCFFRRWSIFIFWKELCIYLGTKWNPSIRLGYNNGRPNQQSGYTEFTPTDASGQNFINPFAIDPNDENIMYYPAGNNLWRNNQIGTIPDNQQGTTVGWSKIRWPCIAIWISYLYNSCFRK